MKSLLKGVNLDLKYGPSILTVYLKNNNTIRLRVVGIVENNCRVDKKIKFAVDLNMHNQILDGYIFVILDYKKMKSYIVGWILFKDLVENAIPLKSKGKTYLTVTVDKFTSFNVFKNIAKNMIWQNNYE